MAKSKADLESELKATKQKLATATKEVGDLKAKAEAMKLAAKQQREAKAVENKKDMRSKIKAAPHQWVQVFAQGLDDGVDFAFNYEGLQFRLISGQPVYLSEILIKHLRACRRPRTKLKQGEAGQAVKVEGWHHNFNVVACEAPDKAEVAVG